MRIFNKDDDPISKHKTVINFPFITAHFHKDTGIKIKVGNEMKPLNKYLFSGEFDSQFEYLEFLQNLKKQQ